MNDAQMNKLQRFQAILEKLLQYQEYNNQYFDNSNAVFYFEEIATLYHNELNDTLIVVFEGDRKNLEFPFTSLNKKDFTTIKQFLEQNIERLAKK